ncbi:MAG: transposase [Coriobacteriia bacterium]
MRWDDGTKAKAAELFDAGYGKHYVGKALNVPVKTVARWRFASRALGKEILFVRTPRHYSFETKLNAARDFLDHDMSKPEIMERYGIKTLSRLEAWIRSYREGGAEALQPKPKGRRPEATKSACATREEELEARVRELELELAIQKRINALADGRKPR